MNIENENIEPLKGLSLASSYSNYIIQRRLNNDSSAGAGAGANAGSKMDLTTYVAIDPPSELVWSPRRGLRAVVLSSVPQNGLNTGLSSSENHDDDDDEVNKITPETAAIPMEYNDIHRDRDDDVSECALSDGRLEEDNSIADGQEPDAIELEPSPMYPMGGRRDADATTDIHTAAAREEPASSNEKENENEISKNATRDSSTGAPLMRNMVPDRKNDLQTLVGDDNDAYDASGKILVEEEEMHPENVVVDEYSPSNSWVRSYRRKGKKKASTEDTGEIVGSCKKKSTEFSSGRRRLSFEQHFTIQNQVEETPRPASYLKPDSSFVYWMSNMMKGFMNSENDTTPVTFTVTNPGRRYSPVTPSSREKRDKSMGFLSILQSMSYLKRTVQEEAMMMMMNDNNSQTRVDLTTSKELDISGNISKRLLLTNEVHNGSKSGNGADRCVNKSTISTVNLGNGVDYGVNKSTISTVNLAASLRINEIDSTENKTSCDSEPRAARTNSFTFTGKRKLDNAENIHCEPLPENKVSETYGHGSDYLSSFWVTRFAPKKLRSSLNHVHADVSNDYDATFPDDHRQPLVRATELTRTDSVGIDITKGHDDDDDDPKLIHEERLKIAEAMASMFVKRLDSLKGIMPFEDDADFSNTICIFCGRKGHRLQDCFHITDPQLEELLTDINTRNDGMEGFPRCFCIKCFQFNHWAHTCPCAASKGSSRTDRAGTGGGVSLTRVGSVNLNKYVGSSSGVNMCKESQVVPQYISSGQQNLDVPSSGIFDAVKMLRLSRTNILKWMKSNTLLSRLDGFFLRLRIGKSEEGQRGLGYHAARITAEQLPSSSRNCVSVDVGGMKCSVESRYISNHDFQEDELIAWWYATTKSDNKFSLEDELRSKLEDRKTLAL